MADPRSILERAGRLAAGHPLPAHGFQRLTEFRERRRRAKRVTAAIFALVLVAVTFGWLAWSLTGAERPRPAREFEGRSPSDVLTSSIVGMCLSVGPTAARAIEQEVSIRTRSHLSVSLTAEWAELDESEEGRLAFELAGPAGTARSDAWTFGGDRRAGASGTVAWSFEDVAPGTYSVVAVASVRAFGGSGSQVEPSAGLENCALTVFVVPVEPT